MDDKRKSERIKDQPRRVLDLASRQRRQRKALEALEADNFQDDPHADLKMSKRAPKFDTDFDDDKPKKSKSRKKSDHFRFKVKKTLTALLEEEQLANNESRNYLTVSVPPSKFPERHFCAVCGFPSNYTCVTCGTRYCCVKCLGTHMDTRCMKWTA